MNNICIKPHIPEGEDGFTLPSSDSFFYDTISFLNSLSALSLATLITTAVLYASSNEVVHLQLSRWGTSTGIFNLNYSSGLQTDSIITSSDKSKVVYLIL